MSNRSYSQRKRDKLDYRAEYFKHNPGLFGCIWKCAYCQRLLIGRRNVQVDHIMPLNNVLGRNARYNLVAACGKCNRDKSDKVDGRVALGYLSKVFEVILFSVQKVALIAIVAIWNLLQRIGSFLISLITYPFTHGTTVTKIIFIGVVLIAVMYLLN